MSKREYFHFPKWKYHAKEDARIVADAEEEKALGDDWFDKADLTNHTEDQSEAVLSETPAGYVPEQFPKWKYHRTETARVVNDADEEDALGDGWFDKSDFTNHTHEEAVPTSEEVNQNEEAGEDDTDEDATEDDEDGGDKDEAESLVPKADEDSDEDDADKDPSKVLEMKEAVPPVKGVVKGGDVGTVAKKDAAAAKPKAKAKPKADADDLL